MNAVEFLKLQKRICKHHENDTCFNCPLNDHCLLSSTDLDYDEEETVRLAEEWEKEHPLRTNGDAITQMLDENLPWGISGIEYEKRFRGDDVILTFSKEMWNEEYKGKYGADGCEGCRWDYLEAYEDPCCDCCKNFKDKWESKI